MQAVSIPKLFDAFGLVLLMTLGTASDGRPAPEAGLAAPSAVENSGSTSDGPAPHKWVRESQQFVPVEPDDVLPPATVLWLRTASACTVKLKGPYPGSATQPVPTDAGFLAANGLETVNLTVPLVTNAFVWHFNGKAQTWRVHAVGPDRGIPIQSDATPTVLSPAHAVFLQGATPSDLFPTTNTLDIRYYHQNHLGSSSVLTDRAGAPVRHTTFYPYGGVRTESQAEAMSAAGYRYSAKEIDSETGLVYFEARYQAPGLNRFLSVDPLHDELTDALAQPRTLSPYAYVRNNPLRHIDPAGMQEEEPSISVPPIVITASPGEPLSNVGAAAPRRSEFASYGAFARAMRGYHRYRKELRQLQRAAAQRPAAPVFGQSYSDRRVQRIVAHYLDKARRMGAETRDEQLAAALGSIITAREAQRGRGKDLNYAAADHYLTMRWNSYHSPHIYRLFGWAPIEIYDRVKPIDGNTSRPDPRVRDWAYRGISAGFADAAAETYGPLPLIGTPHAK